MYTYRDRPFIEARRAYRNALRTHGDELLDEILFRQADRSIDCGEWSDATESEPTYHNASGEVQERLFVAVADAYGIDPHRLDDCLFQLDENEAMLRSPPCGYHERGLDCRNSAPRGIDADGEPFGDSGCGCDHAADRARLLGRLGIRSTPTLPVFEVGMVRHARSNTFNWQVRELDDLQRLAALDGIG